MGSQAVTKCAAGMKLHEDDYAGTLQLMADNDASQEALEQVQKITESDPVNGEDLLGSDDLKRQLREAKEREAKRSAKPPRK